MPPQTEAVIAIVVAIAAAAAGRQEADAIGEAEMAAAGTAASMEGTADDADILLCENHKGRDSVTALFLQLHSVR